MRKHEIQLRTENAGFQFGSTRVACSIANGEIGQTTGDGIDAAITLSSTPPNLAGSLTLT
jgi:hypothetical protein